jgi:hypothetical protein
MPTKKTYKTDLIPEQNCHEARGVVHIKRLSRDLSENFLSTSSPICSAPTTNRTARRRRRSLSTSISSPLLFAFPPLPEPQPASWAAAAVSLPFASPTHPAVRDAGGFGAGGRPGRTGQDVLRRLDAAVRQLLHQEVREPRADPMSVSWSSSRAKELIWLVYSKLTVFPFLFSFLPFGI